MDDVHRIRVEVHDADADRLLFGNFDLTRHIDGVWAGTLTIPSSGVPLRFTARAYDAAGQELFNGTTQQVLLRDGERVSIPLAPYDNNLTLDIPRITVPEELTSSALSTVTVEVDASSGETLSFDITPAPGGGEYFPPTGQITLAGVSGAIVFQYVAPRVEQDAVFTHSVRISNQRGISVRSTFTTRVWVQRMTGGVSIPGVQVQFRPVIHRLEGMRLKDTTSVLVTATVEDDSPESELSYAWAFLPDAMFNPAPSFADQGTRTSTLVNFLTCYTGRVQLNITDGDGGLTELLHPVCTELPAEPDPVGDVVVRSTPARS